MEIPPNSTDDSAFYVHSTEIFRFALNSCGHLWKKASELPHHFLEFARQIFEVVHQKFFSEVSMSDSGMGGSQSHKAVTNLMARTVSHQELDKSFSGSDKTGWLYGVEGPLEDMGSAFNSHDETKLEDLNSEEAAHSLCNTDFTYSEMEEKDYLKLLYDFDNLIAKLSSSPDLKEELIEKLIKRRALVRSELSIYMPENLYWQNGEVCGILVSKYSSFDSSERSIIRKDLSNLSFQLQSPILLFSPSTKNGLECVEESGLQFYSTAANLFYYDDRKGLEFDVIARSS